MLLQRKAEEIYRYKLTDSELEDMVTQNAIPSKQVLGGALPYAFSGQAGSQVIEYFSVPFLKEHYGRFA